MTIAEALLIIFISTFVCVSIGNWFFYSMLKRKQIEYHKYVTRKVERIGETIKEAIKEDDNRSCMMADEIAQNRRSISELTRVLVAHNLIEPYTPETPDKKRLQ